MPKINLKQSFVENPPKPTDKPKTDYFDTQAFHMNMPTPISRQEHQGKFWKKPDSYAFALNNERKLGTG